MMLIFSKKNCLNNQEWSSQSVTMTSQEDHLCHHQHITSKTSSVLDLHTEQSYMRNQRTIQLNKFRWKLSSSWLRCVFILAQTHQSGQEIRNKRIHCSLCRFFPTKISSEWEKSISRGWKILLWRVKGEGCGTQGGKSLQITAPLAYKPI